MADMCLPWAYPAQHWSTWVSLGVPGSHGWCVTGHEHPLTQAPTIKDSDDVGGIADHAEGKEGFTGVGFNFSLSEERKKEVLDAPSGAFPIGVARFYCNPTLFRFVPDALGCGLPALPCPTLPPCKHWSWVRCGAALLMSVLSLWSG